MLLFSKFKLYYGMCKTNLYKNDICNCRNTLVTNNIMTK